MLRTGICDDVYDERFMLRAALEQISESRGIEMEIFEFSSGEGLLKWMKNHTGELDLVFLDIEMKEINGMDTARRLRSLDEGLQLVFVTGYTDYVYDGYSVGALGYIIKPPQKQQLNDVITRALTALHRDENRTFLCRSGEIQYRIPVKDILYFMSDRRKISCVSNSRIYDFYGKLSEVEEQVGENFVRIHQRYLVNAAAVDRMESSRIFIGGEELPVSRNHCSEAMAALTRAMLR